MVTTTSSIRADRLRIAGAPQPSGRGAGALSRAHVTALTEHWLHDLWVAATTGHADPIQTGPGIALACAGSLARRESGPLSDLDLELLLDERCTLEPEQVSLLAERLWYPLWDSRLGLDHAVRTVEESRSTARADLATAAAALDVRCIAGDDRVVSRLRSVLAADWRTDARRRLPELEESIRERHARNGDVDQTLDPDLKEGEGGLRDMTLLRALAASWLADYAHDQADLAHHVLLDTRDALQVATGRPRNKLVLEEHDAVAARLGVDTEEMLRRVSQAGRTVARELQQTMRRALRARAPRVGPSVRRPDLRPLGDGAYVHEGEVVLGRGADLDDPLLPLALARHAATLDLPLSPVTARNLATQVPDLPRPWPAEARAALVALLASGRPLLVVWDTLDDAGLIGRWIPAWEAIRSRHQRNSVHRWTVDRHSLECVAIASELVDRVARPDLLLLAALLHDVGKVAGAGDHSIVGAEIAATTLADLGADPETTATVVRLVREHLALSLLAARADSSDPAAVAQLCAAVDEDPDQLDLLAALTEADSRATGAGVWSVWRAERSQLFVTAARRRLAR
ncbi:[protein-PII] uridylyltransferase [Raineyella antarctica]|uniref:[protein-PII] uridylyltransferase n=1 Tax=Raineyella antarctica TaxID=1577474 RepID=A0A1G6GVJ7_9ACTN|nr:HD domain-containing protein [Raineyella antarctica]SDB86070.1 [protein-PII] uridylyltransferase [Raineyella antarctica]